MSEPIHRFTAHQHGRDRWCWRYFACNVPRPVPVCRTLGHRPVVGGYDSRYTEPSRWVECGRCHVRPTDQGWLDPQQWPTRGVPYTGAFLPARPDTDKATVSKSTRVFGPPRLPWRDATWDGYVEVAAPRTLRAAVKRLADVSVRVKLGGEENALKGHVTLAGVGVYAGVGSLTRGMWDWCGPSGRTVQASLHGWHARVEAWNPDEHSSRCGDPWWYGRGWMLDTVLFGQAEVTRETLHDWQPCPVALPEGTYDGLARVERMTWRRPRGRTRTHVYADWLPADPVQGLPEPGNDDSDFYDGEDAITGCSVNLTPAEVDGDWRAACSIGAAEVAMRQRSRRMRGGRSALDWRPTRGPHAAVTA